MEIETLKKEIMIHFPNVEIGRTFFMKQSILLEEQHGFIPANTHFAEGGCSDEINEPEYFGDKGWIKNIGQTAGKIEAGKNEVVTIGISTTRMAAESYGSFQADWKSERLMRSQLPDGSPFGSIIPVEEGPYA